MLGSKKNAPTIEEIRLRLKSIMSLTRGEETFAHRSINGHAELALMLLDEMEKSASSEGARATTK